MVVKVITVVLELVLSIGYAAEPAALRVLTYNLRYINPGDKGDRTWAARRDLVGEMIVKDRPDIIGLQEALRPMLDDLGELAPGFVEIGSGREDGVAQGEKEEWRLWNVIIHRPTIIESSIS